MRERSLRRGLGIVCLPAFALSIVGCGGSDDARPRATPTGEATVTEATDGGAAWFVDVTESLGLAFAHTSGGSGEMHIPEIMGAGAALVDLDGDGDLDAYLTNGRPGITRAMSTEELRAFDPASGEARNRAYRQDPDGTFVDVTDESGLGDPGYGMGVAAGDIDADGDVDLYVTNVGRDHLYRNRGDGTFEDVTEAAGVSVDGWSTSASFVDVDRDGDLDLYVCRYLDYDPSRACTEFTGRPDFCGPKSFPPVSDVLLRNEGDGTFTDVSASAGMTTVAGAGLGVVCEDLDRDGWVDIYVANDGDANQLWMNRRDGTFADEAMFQGVALNWHGVAEAGMGVLAADFDGDLNLDLFVTHLTRESNTLYRNLGATGFEDVTARARLERPSVPFTGFGTAAIDLDLDGGLDLVILNGRVLRQDAYPDAIPTGFWKDYAEPNLVHLNDGTGVFEDASARVGGRLTGDVEISRGLATGDVDGDGDLDLLVANVEGPARIFRNDAPPAGRWLRIRAETRPGTLAIGSRVEIRAGDRQWVRTVNRGFSYLSSSDPVPHFGVGPRETVDALVVQWTDGYRERFPGGPTNVEITLIRGQGEAAS